ncbi:hypothetical protein OHA79_09595 [Streptomyces sp. NBC_00841]|uniref:hypothetical protein n=1 Tax=Streptomyces sp. NBC_00841 TaxID=2975847 RepID=UPI002DD7D337|nr:hypothetical protein [Streptomyces sp. NBC_00841]WRZ98068.1 hypothetical protein OHA79_09595 [Streptomyces sp. NBC_00841]
MALIREHGEAIEADLGFRGYDLLDMWRGKLSPRKVNVLVRGLPPDSATRMAMNGGEPLWGRADHILADLVDATNSNTWVVANREASKKERSPFPDPYPRPGDAEVPSKREITAADLLAFRERTRKDQ